MSNIFANQNIQNFYQTAYRKDFARKNLFRILSIETGAAGITFDESDLVYVTATTLPKYSIRNIPLPFMGMQFNLPGTAQFPGSDAWNITFRMPQDLSIRKKLEAWTRATFDTNTSAGAYELNKLGTIWLALMSKTGVPIRTYKMVGAYCTNMGEYTLDMTDGGTVVEQAATIAYQFWE